METRRHRGIGRVIGSVVGALTAVVALLVVGEGVSGAAPRLLTVAKDGTAMYTTIQAAAAVAQPGDTVQIAAGVYVEAVKPAASGTAGAPITYRARTGDTVVIDGQKRLYSTNGLVNLDGRSFITMSGITVTNSPRHGIYGNLTSSVVLDHMVVSHTDDGGIVLVGGSRATVSSSEIAFTNERGLSASNEAVTLNNVDGFEISADVVHNCGEEGIDAKYGARNGLIHDNLAYANRGPNIYLDAASTVQVFGNVVGTATNNTKAGILLGVEHYATNPVLNQIDVYNNTMIFNQGSGLTIWKENADYTISNVRIVNNVMYGNTRSAIEVTAPGITGGNVIVNNIMTGNATGPVSGSTAGIALDHNLTSGDPLYVAPDKGDFHLRTGSPAIDTGSSAIAPAYDASGTPRPQGAGVDLGVFER